MAFCTLRAVVRENVQYNIVRSPFRSHTPPVCFTVKCFYVLFRPVQRAMAYATHHFVGSFCSSRSCKVVTLHPSTAGIRGYRVLQLPFTYYSGQAGTCWHKFGGIWEIRYCRMFQCNGTRTAKFNQNFKISDPASQDSTLKTFQKLSLTKLQGPELPYSYCSRLLPNLLPGIPRFDLNVC